MSIRKQYINFYITRTNFAKSMTNWKKILSNVFHSLGIHLTKVMKMLMLIHMCKKEKKKKN